MSTAITHEIPKQSWKTYFNELDRIYEGWAATVEVFAGELGDQHAADGLPLQGISYEPAGSQAGDILIEIGDVGEPFNTHLVRAPAAVRASTTKRGAELDIEIEAEDGTITLVTLRPRPKLPPPGKTLS